VAELERSLIAERVRAGLRNARLSRSLSRQVRMAGWPSIRAKPSNCGYGDPSLTPEGGCRMALRKDKVEIGTSGLTG